MVSRYKRDPLCNSCANLHELEEIDLAMYDRKLPRPHLPADGHSQLQFIGILEHEKFLKITPNQNCVRDTSESIPNTAV